jgi:hypothetical protein
VCSPARICRPRSATASRIAHAPTALSRRRRCDYPVDDAKQAVSYLSRVGLILMPDESHLGGFAAADDVLMFLRSHL